MEIFDFFAALSATMRRFVGGVVFHVNEEARIDCPIGDISDHLVLVDFMSTFTAVAVDKDCVTEVAFGGTCGAHTPVPKVKTQETKNTTHRNTPFHV